MERVLPRTFSRIRVISLRFPFSALFSYIREGVAVERVRDVFGRHGGLNGWLAVLFKRCCRVNREMNRRSSYTVILQTSIDSKSTRPRGWIIVCLRWCSGWRPIYQHMISAKRDRRLGTYSTWYGLQFPIVGILKWTPVFTLAGERRYSEAPLPFFSGSRKEGDMRRHGGSVLWPRRVSRPKVKSWNK